MYTPPFDPSPSVEAYTYICCITIIPVAQRHCYWLPLRHTPAGSSRFITQHKCLWPHRQKANSTHWLLEATAEAHCYRLVKMRMVPHMGVRK